MSNTDSFVDEVSEEIRRDRLFAMMRRYGWIAIVAVLVLVGGASYLEWQRNRDNAAARDLGDAMLASLESESSQSRAVSIENLAADGQAAAIRDLLAAAQYSATDVEKAGDILLSISDDESQPRVYRDLATLKLTLLSDYPMMSDLQLQKLDPLTQPGRPFRISALERVAVLHIERNEDAEALEILRQIFTDGEATPTQRSRASDLIVALGGALNES